MLGIIISNQNTKKIGEKNKKKMENLILTVHPSNSVAQLLSPKKKNQVGFARHIMRRKVGPN